MRERQTVVVSQPTSACSHTRFTCSSLTVPSTSSQHSNSPLGSTESVPSTPSSLLVGSLASFELLFSCLESMLPFFLLRALRLLGTTSYRGERGGEVVCGQVKLCERYTLFDPALKVPTSMPLTQTQTTHTDMCVHLHMYTSHLQTTLHTTHT